MIYFGSAKRGKEEIKLFIVRITRKDIIDVVERKIYKRKSDDFSIIRGFKTLGEAKRYCKERLDKFKE